jgi:hypothetical protein
MRGPLSTVLKLRINATFSPVLLHSDLQKPNGCRCGCDTLTRCRTISSSVSFNPHWIWIIPSGLLWVGLPPPRMRHIGGTPGFHSMMSQGRTTLRSSMVRSISTLNGSFPTQSVHGNVGRCRTYATSDGLRSWRGREPFPDHVRHHRTLERTSRGTSILKQPNIRSFPIGVLTGDSLDSKIVYGSPTPRLSPTSSTPLTCGSNLSPFASLAQF